MKVPLCLQQVTLKMGDPVTIDREKGLTKANYVFLALVLVMSVAPPIYALTKKEDANENASGFDEGEYRVSLRPGNFIRLSDAYDNSYAFFSRPEDFFRKMGQYAVTFLEEALLLNLINSPVILTTQEQPNTIYVLKIREFEGEKEFRIQCRTIQTGHSRIIVEEGLAEFDRAGVGTAKNSGGGSVIPWLEGFSFHHFPWIHHEELGSFWVFEKEDYSRGVYLKSVDDSYGLLYTSRGRFPEFVRQSDGAVIIYRQTERQLINKKTGDPMPMPKKQPR